MAKEIEAELDHWVPPAKPNDDYPDKFNLACIKSIEE